MSVAHDDGGLGPYSVEDLHAREDEGRGLELEDGWLIPLSPSTPHNIACRKIHELLEEAISEAGASVYSDRGGDWEISTPSGIRKPDVFIAPKALVDDSFYRQTTGPLPGGELLLVVEVVSPASGSERTDRVRKVKEYAAIGIPQYWLVDVVPEPKVRIFALDDTACTYRLARAAASGEILELEIEADETIKVSFDPKMLADTWQR